MMAHSKIMTNKSCHQMKCKRKQCSENKYINRQSNHRYIDPALKCRPSEDPSSGHLTAPTHLVEGLPEILGEEGVEQRVDAGTAVGQGLSGDLDDEFRQSVRLDDSQGLEK